MRGKVRHDAQRIIPEGVNLHRLADAGRDHPIIHFGIHPGKLHARFSGKQQTVRLIHVNVVACAAHVPFNNILQDGEQIAQQGVIAGNSVVSA